MHDEDSDVLQPMIIEDNNSGNHHRSWQRRPTISIRRWRSKARSTVLGWAIGTFALFTSLTFVAILLDAEVRFDSPVRKYLHDPEHEDVYKAALDGRGARQGENIWADAMMDAMWALGYSMLTTKDTPETYAMFRRHHRNVHRILWLDAVGHGKTCRLWNSSCVYAGGPLDDATVPLANSTHVNIPIWKVFNMHWWNGPLGPLGRPFTASNVPAVKSPPFHSRQAYVFAKSLSYFERPDYILADPSGNTTAQLTDDFYEALGRELNMTWVGSFKKDAKSGLSSPPPGITQLEKMDRATFQHTIAESRVVLGIGRPVLSPTPYEALCLGVPCINVVQGWDRADPENRAKWYTSQHDAIMRLDLGEPYVYHVRVGDREALKRAVRLALGTPIPRYGVERGLEMSAVVDRVKAFLEMDLRPLATRQLQITNFTFQD
ncbi:hypothetical protein FRB90_012660 [Tulasnella sp. 427]|nr:hypothetical protein FRB90_012660 [Tulasnella sp. 427]